MKTIIATLIAATFSVSAMASHNTVSALNADQFTVSGSAAVGGYYDSKQGLHDDWATGVTLGLSYVNGPIVGYVEHDVMFNYGLDDMSGEIVSDLDKAWIGFDTGLGIASYGVENDTALDAVDGAGNLSVEFGLSAGDASDAFNVVKFEGGVSTLVYGASFYEMDEFGGTTGLNGYVGVKTELANIYFGVEGNDDDTRTATVSGNVHVTDNITVGANAWQDEVDHVLYQGGYVSASVAVGKLSVAGGVGQFEPTGDSQEDNNYANVGAKYAMTSSVDLLVDFEKNFASEDNKVFAQAAYNF